jgi:hypothetical protein
VTARWRTATLASAAAVAVAWLAMAAASAQGPTARPPRTADGKPNLNGIWQALNSANVDLQAHAARAGLPQAGAIGAEPAGLGVVVGGEIPYRREALAKKQENFNNRRTADPEAKCFMPGVPRATYLPYPFQIVQSTKQIMIVYEYASSNRTIHFTKQPESPVDTWMGQSIGRWEGDTLVVDVASQIDQTWFDRAGNYHSDALHVTERYTPTGPDTLWYEARIDDPKTFTRPWQIEMPLYRRLDKGMQLLDFRCVEFSEELLYGHLRKKE